MTAHLHSTHVEGCYRCDLSRDETEAIEAEIAAEAQAAWLAYRDDYMRRRAMSARRAGHQLRRREFIAGYVAGVSG